MKKETGNVLVFVLIGVVLVVTSVAGTSFYLGKGSDALFGFFTQKQNVELDAVDTGKTKEQYAAINQKLNELITPTSTPTAIPTTKPTEKPTPTVKPTNTPIKEPSPAKNESDAAVNSNQTLNLTAASNEIGKVSLNWTLNGDPINGFKEVWSTDANPTYPEDHWHYDADLTLRSYTWSGLQSGQTLHFRVGVFKSGQGVTAYSNDVSVTVK